MDPFPDHEEFTRFVVANRKVFDDILRALDTQYGKHFMITNSAGVKDINAEETKPKLDLFRTVVAAIPRLIRPHMSEEGPCTVYFDRRYR